MIDFGEGEGGEDETRFGAGVNELFDPGVERADLAEEDGDTSVCTRCWSEFRDLRAELEH